jgi:hypothetical protein
VPHSFVGFVDRAPRLEVYNGRAWLCIDEPRRKPGLVSLAEAMEDFRSWKTAIESDTPYGRVLLARAWGLCGVVLYYGREIVACEIDESTPYRGTVATSTQLQGGGELTFALTKILTRQDRPSLPYDYETWLGLAREAWEEVDTAIALRAAIRIADEDAEEDD